jgi:spermidine/putrescine transport system substrate-binding protein
MPEQNRLSFREQKQSILRGRLTTTLALMVILLPTFLLACGGLRPSLTPAPQPLAEELIFYDWAEDMPQSVLDAFSAEYGVQVSYLTYETQDEGMANIRSGGIYDVVVLDNDNIPALVAEGLLADIDYDQVPNFKNILPNFRDLAYDPNNKHSVPFNWGTTGLLVRTDLVHQSVTRWADLWELPAGAKIGLRGEVRDALAPPLKALGYSANSEDPKELEAALAHLLKIKQDIVMVDSYAEALVPLLTSGEIVVAIGWADDALQAREASQDIAYVLPQEGALVWGDNFVIPASSPRKHTAEIFLNFILRPEVSAQIVNQNYYACANEAALPFIDPEIINDPVIFPPNQTLKNAEIYLPLSADGQELYQAIWGRFLSAIP